MKKVPDAVRQAFYAGARSSKLPFCVNDSVQVVDGEYSGCAGSVISVESIDPDLQFLVELGDTGQDVVLSSSVLRFVSDTPPTS